MNRNIWIILLSSSVFSLCFGVYDFALPLFLKDRGLSFQSMGLIFAASSFLMVFLRVFVGAHSDVRGRKPFYGLGLACSAAANLLIPFFSGLPPLLACHCLRDVSAIVRDTMRSILVFENAREKFLRLISRTQGIELFLQGAGTLLAGSLIAGTGVRAPFWLCAGLLGAAFVFFSGTFRENFVAPASARSMRLREILRIDLPWQLRAIAFSAFVFSFGLSISHSFIMPLFFIDKFGVSVVTVSVVLMIHRMSLGVPMLVYGNFIKRHLMAIYIGALLFEGASIAVSALIPAFLPAAAIWLLHDIFGAALWLPVQNTLVQRFAREERRGKDVSEVAALGSLGGIAGPIVAGALAPFSISLPFLASGIMVMASVVFLFRLVGRPETRTA